jgi:cobalamin-dependent methionine synthase I
MDVLEMAAERHMPAVLSSTGASMPTGTDERMERAIQLIELAVGRGMPLADLHVDPLIIPIGVDAEAGAAYLEAVRQLRARYGPELHITGGISNVSFGMPARRLISDVFLDLCVQAGQDSGIVDPVAADIAKALAPDRDAEPYRLAANLLTGGDAFGVEFIEAFRAGRLPTAP